MAKRSFFSFFSSPFRGGELTTFLDLDYHKDRGDQGNLTDVGKLDLPEHRFTTPALKITGGRPEIPIIGIGGAGIRLLNKIVTRVKSYDMEYPTMAFDTDKSDLEQYDNITHKFHIPGSDLGSGHQYRIAASRTKKVRDKVKEDIRRYMRDLKMAYKHDIVFLLLGSGGTGVGAAIEIAEILKEIGKRPVPFLILPTKDEMSRIKFNAAAALYHFNYAPKDRCLNLMTICIDNELILSSNSKKHYASVIAASNERIAATLGDIIATTELESHAYSADLNEFLEIFRDLKGIGALQYLHVNNPSQSASDIFMDQIDSSLSIDVDILDATRAYFFISAKKEQISAEEYRDLMLKFDNADVFNKLYEVNEEQEFFGIRGIYTGITSSDRIRNLMQLAEDARVEILNKEIEQQEKGKVNPKIDRLSEDEEIDVKTGQELVEERAEEYAKMRREGEE